MKSPVTYIDLMENFSSKREAFTYGNDLDNEVEWVRRDRTPRQEAFYSKLNAPYTYGSGGFARTYYPSLDIPPLLASLWFVLERDYGTKYEACFLNKYEHAREHLGWHADDSDVIDDSRPIAVISFGAERELWFRPNSDTFAVEKLLLETGSLCIMHAGMQDTHQHRIPKHHAECGTRISLTFRGLV
jgi:alkylated DNA repair dioxygenase AlkB